MVKVREVQRDDESVSSGGSQEDDSQSSYGEEEYGNQFLDDMAEEGEADLYGDEEMGEEEMLYGDEEAGEDEQLLYGDEDDDSKEIQRKDSSEESVERLQTMTDAEFRKAQNDKFAYKPIYKKQEIQKRLHEVR